MSNKTFKDGYKPGEIILDEDTGILYDPRYGYPRTHVCHGCSANNYCPDDCIKHKDGILEGIDYDYCKGCGVCAKVCPFKAIEMKSKEE